MSLEPCTREGVEVHADTLLSDTILFELPDWPDAASLFRRLRADRPASLDEDGGPWNVTAHLRPEADDLATLLREVEAWVGERSLDELWYQLDGRSYLLQAPRDRGTATAA